MLTKNIIYMKYINKREDFLKKSKYVKVTNLINERSGAFENDTPWGDSLVGRLINSFFRKAKIGYNSTKIEPLVEAFKAQLDILIANSLSKDTLAKFNILRLKSLFNEIREVCTNSVSDPDKLDELIGDHEDLWDQSQQNSGAWRTVLTGGLVPDFHEIIDTVMDKDQLEDAGINKDKLLDQVSIFIDNLRRLTSNTPVPSQQQTSAGFSQLFGSLVNRFSLINESLYYDFEDMILEKTDVKTLQDRLKYEEDKLKNEKDPNKRKQLEIDIAATKAGINRVNKAPNTPNSTTQLNSGTQSSGTLAIGAKPVGSLPAAATQSGTQSGGNLPVATTQSNEKIKKIKELAKKCVAKKLDTKEEILKDVDAIDFIKTIGTLNSNDFTYLKSKNPKETFDEDVNTLKSSKEVKEIKEEPKKEESKKEEPKKEKVEESIYNYTGYDYIYEATGQTNSTVVDCWNMFVDGARIPDNMTTITQNQIDELNRLTVDNTNGTLVCDLSQRPDPIISICRIFKRANDIYFTPVIPSGRTNGKVSNKTFLEYEKLGGAASSQSDASSPGYGPWAVKKLRDKWTDGIMAVIEDQKYRKILANLRFIVPGSEDNFNRAAESLIKRYDRFMRVYEAETETAVGGALGDKKSHGQILFDFINDLLDNKTAANFDEQRRILLKKYFEPFGLKVTVDKTPQPAPIVHKPDCDPSSIFWLPIARFDTVTTQNYTGKFYAIPIVKDPKTKNHEMVFLQLLNKVTVRGAAEAYYVKFVFDNQLNVKKYKEGKQPNYGITTDYSTQQNPPRNVYYGIITKPTGNKFTLVYANVANRSVDKIYGEKNAFTISSAGSKTGPSGNFTLAPLSILMESDAQNQAIKVNTDFCGVINNENNRHDRNLQIASTDPDYIGPLSTQLVKKMEKELQNP